MVVTAVAVAVVVVCRSQITSNSIHKTLQPMVAAVVAVAAAAMTVVTVVTVVVLVVVVGYVVVAAAIIQQYCCVFHTKEDVHYGCIQSHFS